MIKMPIDRERATDMTEEMKMYVALTIFVALPVGIMGMAWLADLFDRWLATDRPTDQATDQATDRPTDR